MSLYRDYAIVLRTYKLGEADRIVVLMTRGHGKVRAVGKGVRKTSSKFGSRLEPGSYIQVQLHQGRGDLDIVTQTETVEPYRRTREDLSRLSRSSSLLEAVEQLAQEREPTPKLFDMLLGGLRTVEESNPAMISALEAGGVRCTSCGGGRPVSPEALSVSRAVLGGGLNAVLTLPEGPVTYEVESLATKALEAHIERRLRALRLLHEA